MSDVHTLTAPCWCQPAAVDGHVNEDGSQPGKPDLDDTSRCPLERGCSTCAAEEDDRDLIIATAATPVGVFCFTLCKPCADQGFTPRVALPAAVTSVLEHCEHLGCSLDEMAAAIAAERVDRGSAAVRPLPTSLGDASEGWSEYAYMNSDEHP